MVWEWESGRLPGIKAEIMASKMYLSSHAIIHYIHLMQGQFYNRKIRTIHKPTL